MLQDKLIEAAEEAVIHQHDDEDVEEAIIPFLIIKYTNL